MRLSFLGGLTGTITGVAATAIYALTQHWSVQVPGPAMYGGMVGLYLATRAARLSPTQALRTI